MKKFTLPLVVATALFGAQALAASEEEIQIARNHGYFEAALAQCPNVQVIDPQLRGKWADMIEREGLQQDFADGRDGFGGNYLSCLVAINSQEDPEEYERSWLGDVDGRTEADANEKALEPLSAATVAAAPEPKQSPHHNTIVSSYYAYNAGMAMAAAKRCGNLELREDTRREFVALPFYYEQHGEQGAANSMLSGSLDFQASHQIDPMQACFAAKQNALAFTFK
ncbi:MAG: hypothetical protein KKG78_06080 [Alphaproteobacteria bacterium]|nr:hypothetical protein [Alphaproteobacteria bacterium]